MGGGPGYKNDSEEFDGEGWASTPNLNTSKHSSMAAGSNAEGIISFGGYTSSPPTVATNATESWSGSSWTTVNSMNTGRYGGYGAGSQTAGIVAGGIVGPGTMQSKTETFDGTSWTETSDLATARGRLTTAGITTAALAASGQTPSLTTATEEFNSSTNVFTAAAWASGGVLNTARYGSAQMGTTTAGLVAGGSDPSGKKNESEQYNGTSWSEGENLSTARGFLAAGGNSTQTAGIAFGGTTSTGPDNSGITNASEEYNGSSWVSGNPMNYSARNLGGFGEQTSAVAAGGIGPPTTLATTGEYGGTTWAAGTALPAGLQDNYGMTGANLTVGLLAGGEGPPGSVVDTCLEYDGTNWTAGGTLPTATRENGMAGTQDAALMFGGADPSSTTRTIGYDGTAWSTRPNLATAQAQSGGAGTSSSAFCAGGLVPSPGATTATEVFTGETETANIKDFTTS